MEISDEEYEYFSLKTVVSERDVEAARFILVANPERVNIKFNSSDTSLHVAIENYDVKMVKFLISFGADITIANYVHQDALMLALFVLNFTSFYEKKCDDIKNIIYLIIDHGSNLKNEKLSTLY